MVVDNSQYFAVKSYFHSIYIEFDCIHVTVLYFIFRNEFSMHECLVYFYFFYLVLYVARLIFSYSIFYASVFNICLCMSRFCMVLAVIDYFDSKCRQLET